MIKTEFEEAFSSDWLKRNVPDQRNEFVILRKIIPWGSIMKKLSQYYSPDKGKIGISLRIMVALLILQKLRKLSDREVVQRVRENDYLQYFCNVPEKNLNTFINETSPLSSFRKRLGVEGIAIVEEEIFDVLKWSGIMDRENCLMDSTVLNAAIVYPTDVQLVFKALKKMADVANHQKIAVWWNHKQVKKRLRAFGRDKKTHLSVYLEEFNGYFQEALRGFEIYCQDSKAYSVLSPLLPC